MQVGDNEAVAWLLKMGAGKGAAINGYAIRGDVAQVNKLVSQKNKKDLNRAVNGYARGDHHMEQIDKLLKKGVSINSVATGFASSGNAAMVDQLIARGANISNIVFYYALNDHVALVEKWVDKWASANDERFIDAAEGFAQAGNVVEVDKLIARGLSRHVAVMNYARAGYYQHADALHARYANNESDLLMHLAHMSVGCVMSGHIDQLEILKNTPDVMNAAIYLMAMNHVEADVVKRLLDFGGSRDHLVYCYARFGYGKQVEALIDAGANRDEAVRGYAERGDLRRVYKLLAASASKQSAITGFKDGKHDQYAADIQSRDLAEFELFNNIYKLERYGNELEKQGRPRVGARAKLLADEIAREVERYLQNPDNAKESAANLSKIIADGKKSMGENRKFKDIIAHIVLGLSLIGLAIIGVKKALSQTKSGFLNSTKRQKLVDEVKASVHNIMKPKV